MLIVLRHGRTAANASGLLLGRLDVELDEVGGRQATAAAEAIAGAFGPVTRIVSSPLARTRATAAAVSEAVGGVPVEVDDRWLELDYGSLDGTPLADVPAEVWARWRSDVDHAPPGGESLAELGRRVRSACDDLSAEAVQGNVVVVTHVSPIKAAAAWAMGVGDEVSWRLFVAPASITVISVSERGPTMHGFNRVEHLTALG